jgi:hypothetical protein
MPETTETTTTKPSKVKVVLKSLALIVLAIMIYLGAAVATGFISASNNIELVHSILRLSDHHRLFTHVLHPLPLL